SHCFTNLNSVPDTPEAQIILGASLNPDAIREGSDVYFDCIVNAHPPVYKVEWRHNEPLFLSRVSNKHAREYAGSSNWIKFIDYSVKSYVLLRSMDDWMTLESVVSYAY
ncbi:hypothetical protein HHI36_000722, partial [Cryptolaemus montrouzieri]